jgi:hypothetical protein
MKRGYVTFLMTVAMILAVIFLLVTRARSPHDAPAEVVAVKETVDAGDAGPTPDAATVVAVVDAAKPAEVPLKVVTYGWELAAPGPLVTTPIELSPETALDAVEARLARGGADPQGADIAIEPLPAFVASFDRLRALEPRAFLVVGFSRGREEVHGVLTKPPPGADEVKLAALSPSNAAEARAFGSETATVVGLFALDLLGVPPSRIRFVAPGSADAKAAPFSAITKGAPDDRRLAFSTADVSRLVPLVAVAPKAVLDARPDAVRDWAKAWLDAIARSRADIPGLARRLAAKEGLPLSPGVGGAPDALVLVERLGQLDAVAIEQAGTLLGPLARGPVTLETLMQRTWPLARAAGMAANAAPEPLPIDARVIGAIGPREAAPSPAPSFGAISPNAVPLLAYRATTGDTDAVAQQMQFLAGVFERASFRVSAKGGAKAATAIAAAAAEKGVAAARIATAPAEPAGAFAEVVVLSPP